MILSWRGPGSATSKPRPVLKGLTDNPAYQWWREPASMQRDSWWELVDRPAELAGQVALMRELGVDLFRFELPWRALVPEMPGHARYDRAAAADPEWTGYRWGRVDAIIRALLDGGIAPVPEVVFAPQWAQAAGALSPAAPPARPEYFEHLMTALAVRYRGSVRHWELWNEPDHPHSWTGTLREYVELVARPGATAVRREAPECTLLIGGLADARNLRSIHRAGGADLYDVTSIHHYPSRAATGSAAAAVKQARAIEQAAARQGRPVWLTECGIATEAPSVASSFGGVADEAGQAALVQGLFSSSGADAVFMYQLRDTAIVAADGRLLKLVHWGLVSADLSRKKAAFDVYAAALTVPAGAASRS